MKLHHQQVTSSRFRLETANQQLQVLHRVFRHNLRNGMTVIQGYVELTRESVASDRTTDHLTTVDETVNQTLALSEKLSLLNDVGPRPTEKQSVGIVELIRRIRERFRSNYPKITITTSMPTQAAVVGEHSLKHVLHEVFESAVEPDLLPDTSLHDDPWIVERRIVHPL